jgi:predicted membrane-bound dolichyl-phosphate-mannose-protein mannosyltransferase
MKKFVLTLHFILATIVTAMLACLAQTQMVLHGLSQLDVQISFSERLYMSWQDLAGLLPSYGSIILLGLAIGFGATKLIRRYTSIKSPNLYIFAGGAVMAVILIAMQPVLGVTLIAGARSSFGIILQIIAGMIGGFCFMRLRKPQHSAQ